MIHLVIIGANGRMGRRLVALAELDENLCVTASVGRDDASPANVDADVVIDFSTPKGTRRALAIAADLECALLVGTTGLPREIAEEMGMFARSHPVMVAPNLAPGVAICKRLVTDAVRAMSPDVEVDLVEIHHRGKRDRPSGTALALAAAIEAEFEGALPADRIDSIRRGTVIGEHRIILKGPDEEIEIVHRAASRDLFARGALRAASWLSGQPAGRYAVEDMLDSPA
ncbi:MAG: 4-hydroxy-tetrahydrodipicolinate reductase [Phycisphaerales bacterium]|nr:4-hydroxy-tetrahydrodipicolinate reductase [Phycisphaerae bacterium]NNF43809.1 4-hydroxy-tetrahydrodipicolinate reductase [Phycisphaerales bacterium]NNM27205.1 4-hydroxy-tetrahydrodipicolinate reductase [Phycisphaerales bacterium]